MKITLIWVGKTNEKYLKEGISIFTKRLSHYCNFEIIEVKDISGIKDNTDLKKKEGDKILELLKKEDYVILLDENGPSYSSVKWSKWIESHQVRATKRLVFVIGGAFGFSEEMYDQTHAKLSLSKMTFSHQMIRLFFTEQLYRAFTIIKNEKYHNE